MNRNSKTRYQLEALFHQASEDGAADRGDSPRPDQGDCHDEDAFDALSKQRPAVELIKGLADRSASWPTILQGGHQGARRSALRAC